MFERFTSRARRGRRRLTSGEQTPESAEIPFSAVCVRVLQYAAEEADRLTQDAIGTEQLLLGLLREERTVAADVLAVRGLRIEAVRKAIKDLVREGEEPEPPGPPPTRESTYRWPTIPFVPSSTVHILHSGMCAPEQPVINHALNVFSSRSMVLICRSALTPLASSTKRPPCRRR